MLWKSIVVKAESFVDLKIFSFYLFLIKRNFLASTVTADTRKSTARFFPEVKIRVYIAFYKISFPDFPMFFVVFNNSFHNGGMQEADIGDDHSGQIQNGT